MHSNDAFSSYHPTVNFLYFGLVLGFSMFFMHPACLFISLACAICYHVRLNKKNSISFLLKFAMPMLLLTAVINPAFNHKGTIILCYLPKGNPLTLESILYGIAAGVMLVAVLLWFACFNSIMTSDKFIYLFGKIIPSLSLLISMILRFAPKFKVQFKNVKEAQSGIEQDSPNDTFIKRIKNAVNCFSIMITWSLENAIDTADSMKSRGYGLKGRTAFSIYNFRQRDKYALVWLCFCGICMISAGISGSFQWSYFPSINGAFIKPNTIAFFAIYFALCITPIVIDIREERKWKFLKSKI